ncbi:MAG: YdiU family protein [Rhodospirillales bacterium]
MRCAVAAGDGLSAEHPYIPDMNTIHFPFENSYGRLPERFYTRLSPTAVTAPQSIIVNPGVARSLGLDADTLTTEAATRVFAGNAVPDGADPLAMAYAGHQFGHFVPQLGDGRAILLGEIVDRDGVRQDIHLKGAGRTPYSRGGDGRAALGPVLREYIVSAHMHALGIPTTRALAAVTTGEAVYRDDVLPGAVLTRVAASHLRIGTFEYFTARRDAEAVKTLIDYAIDRHYPDIDKGAGAAAALLEGVLRRQSSLVAKWLSVGFIHGVMNTDNTSISGETIDYGPCAFIDTYRPDKVFSSIDTGGRYAFMNQPAVLQWNLGQLAECLLPFIDERQETAVGVAQDIIDGFPDIFSEDMRRAFARKLGLNEQAPDAMAMALSLLEVMAEQKADFTLTFRNLAEAIGDDDRADAFLGQFEEPGAVGEWLNRWRARVIEDNESADIAQARLNAANPAVIARNHLVEAVIRAAEDRSDYAPLHEMMEVVEAPFADQPPGSRYVRPPQPGEEVMKTFCGT